MYRLGIDIGGTFTDLVLVNAITGDQLLGKVLTTPDNPSLGALDGVKRLLQDAGIEAGDLRHVIHGTTLVINALIEQKGARTGLLTTRGFRDILEMRRGKRFDIDDLFIEVPSPLVPRSRVGEIAERMDHSGRAIEPLDDVSARAAVEAMVAQGVEAIAVSFLHAYRNGAHEERVREMIREVAPDVAVSLSSEVSPDVREYERTSTTVANAYTQPIMRRYLDRMAEELARTGYNHDLYLMLSDAGLTTVDTATAFPIRLMESGPAGGAVTARYYSELLGRPNLVAFDMGGTTAKIMFIADGEIITADELETARRYRFKRGSGIPIRIPVVEMLEIGSGGGGIAALNEMGLLKVGPHSAGAQPGPACYGRGGELPTVTDANLLLGYLNPDYFLGGRMKLDAASAQASMEPLCATSGLSPERVAWGIHEIVTEDMAQAAQLHLLERGVDPRKFALLAFGGAGPLHACGLARKLGISEVIIPYAAGVASAFGFLAAPLSITLMQGHPTALKGADTTAINALLARLEEKGRRFLKDAGVADGEIRLRRFASLRYRGQSSELKITLSNDGLDEATMDDLTTAFSDEFERVYGRANRRVGVEALNWQVQVSGPKPQLATAQAVARATNPSVGERMAYFAAAGGRLPTSAIPRSILKPGIELRGPLLIEEDESTTVIPPDTTLTVDEYFNLIIKLDPKQH
ncbi:hydantoinase/oxoprolinase family protein [Shinella sp.]|uniref:hydantoinase/oxoprolinase family protein n=1 Tax=Shinella sp. TaxID=1870904 RepID=UPI003F700827